MKKEEILFNESNPMENVDYYLKKYNLLEMARERYPSIAFDFHNFYCFECEEFHFNTYYCPNKKEDEPFRGRQIISRYARSNAKQFPLNTFNIVEVLDNNRFHIVQVVREIKTDRVEFKKGILFTEYFYISKYMEYDYNSNEPTFAYIRQSGNKITKTKKIEKMKEIKGELFTIGIESLKNCENFYLKTGYKEFTDLIDIDFQGVTSLMNYICYIGQHKKNNLELIAKAGLTTLAESLAHVIDGRRSFNISQKEILINRDGTKLEDIVHLPKNVVNFIKNSKLEHFLNEESLICLEKIHSKEFFLQDFLEFLVENTKGINSLGLFIGDIYRVVSLGFTPSNIVNYLNRVNNGQAIEPLRSIRIWIDYLDMASLTYEKYDKYPNSLKKAHDLALRDLSLIKNEALERAYKDKLVDLLHLEYSNEDFSIIVPRETKELIIEGDTLGHCVASYIQDVSLGKTVVLFLRENSNLGKPFYTIELRDNKLRQIQGMTKKGISSNAKADKFINEWLKEKIDCAS